MKDGAGLIAAVGAVILTLFAARPGLTQDVDGGWPREISTAKGLIVLYQPQVEEFDGNRLSARAAVSVTLSGSTEPVFGAVWFDSRVDTDRDARTVDIVDVKVPNARFPELSDDQEGELSRFLEREIPSWQLTLSLDRLVASLELVEERLAVAGELRSDPPTILFVDYPAILVSMDGEPRILKIEGGGLEYVANTAFTIVRESMSDAFYLYAGAGAWYTARDAKGPWEVTTRVPASVRDLTSPEDEDPVDTSSAPASPPEIIVATEPTELIVTDGAPDYTPLGTDMLEVSNTESDVVVELEGGRHFVLISGRWFAASSIQGPWTHVQADELPAVFANIPDDSELAHLRTWVAGTEEAQEAVLDAQIPQTSAINRDATIEVTYDGDPQFDDIQDTELQYAVNTPNQVIKFGDQYYCAADGVWYVADSAQGPWTVATSVPQEIYNQPPASPTYNTTYVHVYHSTPTVVYAGYYPGYTHSYVHHGCVVYGTGYSYRPWYGSHYYPRPATYGFSVRYNPYYGWSFGLSYSTGPFTFSIGRSSYGRYGGGYFGPVGYRPYYSGYNRGWKHGAYHGSRAGFRAGYRAGQADGRYRNQNIYNRPENRARNAPATRPAGATRPTPSKRPTPSTTRANNVYADRSGNVHRRSGDGSWQDRESGHWSQSATPTRAAETRSATTGRRSTSPSTRSRSTSPSTRSRSASGGSSSLQRSYNSRSRGSTRTQTYRGAGQRAGGSRPARRR